jgi:hypothetical protein
MRHSDAFETYVVTLVRENGNQIAIEFSTKLPK